ncbi:MAG: substrate-binding domain-containing protein [Bacteroidales bacterium]|nr:substrate-binding domain-containing protein [Bacteroidales bacterium]
MKNRYIIAIILLVSLFAVSCKNNTNKKEYIVGVSQCSLDDAWRESMVKELMVEASNYDNIKLIIKDAHNDNELQKKQLKELVDEGSDILIVSPFESKPLVSTIEEINESGIPVIITDRKIESDNYLSFVGADNFSIGKMAGEYAFANAPKNANILEIQGLATSSPAKERHDGFMSAMIDRQDVSFKEVKGNWLYSDVKEIVKKDSFPDINFIYSHNDMMAIAAREIFGEKNSKGENIKIIGIDATPEAGLEAVADGRIDASFLYPTGAQELIKVVEDIINGKKIDKNIILESGSVEKRAAQSLILQSKKMFHYQEQIQKQASKLDVLFNQYNFMTTSLVVISLLMIGFILLSGYVYVVNHRIKRVNNILKMKSLKEEQQNKKLIKLNAEIEQVTAQKLAFFTNVSHEVRTPLTLIIGPLERLMRIMNESEYISDLELIHKNASRLLRVINQILDFRKVENNKQTLKIEKTDIIAFTAEVKTYFEKLASINKITYTFDTDIKESNIWIDQDLIEKVLVNLLSNAFKFTENNGNVSIRIWDNHDRVFISVRNSGKGIEQNKINHLFDRFYTDRKQGSSGTGIGLHLVKEYVSMHKGEIKVDSSVNNYAEFTFFLPKNKDILLGENVAEIDNTLKESVDNVLNDELHKEMLSKVYPYTVLVVDDEDDVREYLKSELCDNFNVITASNGKQGLDILLKEDVSIVLSDVMMPEMNGFDLCKKIKSDIAISHIPVILLTALSDIKQQIYGITEGADAYIKKPFHIDFLKVKIISLLQQREVLREKIISDLNNGLIPALSHEKVESMDDLFLNKFMEQLEKVYSDADYNIEKLSEVMNMSRGHLHRKIKNLTGITPVELLRNYRLSKAAQMLKEKRYNVNEITYMTGFSSPAYFSKCFKSVYNTTPTDYK